MAVDVGCREPRQLEVLAEDAQPVAGFLPVEPERRLAFPARGDLLLARVQQELVGV